MSRGPSTNRDDAMLARKHEGWKCGSCEKDLVNMSGMPADYHNWKCMPRRNNERIPNVMLNL
jgi:transposase-like protein